MAILSISREYRSGGEEIGRSVAEILGYDFVDKERLIHDIHSAGEKWENLSREVDEVAPSLWERFDWQYRGYVALVEAHILEYALRNRVVLIGRGSHILLRGVPYALKVRITAPLETRIEHVMVKDRVDRRTAQVLIEKTDRARGGYIKSNYGEDWGDPQFYDLVFNTGLQSYEQVAKLLIPALQELDRKFTPEAERRLREQAVAARVKARLVIDPKVFVPTLEVLHDGTAVVLRGVVHTPKEYHYLEETACRFAADLPVRNELHYRG
jgi:cytidylate kinase